MPTRQASTVPSGGKPTKFGTMFSSIRCRPSTFSRLTTCMVWPVAGWMMDTPIRLNSHESRTTRAAMRAKSVDGLGNRLPTRSITDRKR
jgi:hypothetical protein